jgi:pilus assembly protein CpaE
MPIICAPDARPHDLPPNVEGEIRAVQSLGSAYRVLAHDPAETLIVIGAGIPADDALDFSARLRMERPAVGVILIHRQPGVSLLVKALQSGVREVVAEGDMRSLAAACARSNEVSRRFLPSVEVAKPAYEGQIVTVFAPKGGCGKTTTSVNLAVALARTFDRRVCLVDLDLSSGDIAITVQLDPVRTIVDAVSMTGHVDTTGAASLLTNYQPGLDMLLAPVAPNDAEKVSPALVRELLTALRDMFDYVIVDSAAYLNEYVLTALDLSVHHVLLTTPDLPALKNLRVTIDMLDLLCYPQSARSVVVNGANAKTGLSIAEIDQALRVPIAAEVPWSSTVQTCVNNGTPITVAYPSHPVSQAFTALARDRLLGLPAAANKSTGPLTRLRNRRRAAA